MEKDKYKRDNWENFNTSRLWRSCCCWFITSSATPLDIAVSRLDDCNSLLHSPPTSSLHHPQSFLNTTQIILEIKSQILPLFCSKVSSGFPAHTQWKQECLQWSPWSACPFLFWYRPVLHSSYTIHQPPCYPWVLGVLLPGWWEVLFYTKANSIFLFFFWVIFIKQACMNIWYFPFLLKTYNLVFGEFIWDERNVSLSTLQRCLGIHRGKF